MCRLALYRGPLDLDRALKLSARYDPLDPYGDRSHPDGWGYAAVLEDGSVVYYRSGRPAWLDGHRMPMASAGVAHVRAASEGEPKGVLHSHPYQVQASTGSTLYVAHNGSVDKAALAAALGRRVDPRLYTDSHILALFLAERWEDPEGAFREALPHVKTALNVAVLELPGPRGYIYAHHRTPHDQYYAVYRVKLGPGEAAVSSTLLRHLRGEAERVEGFLRLF